MSNDGPFLGQRASSLGVHERAMSVGRTTRVDDLGHRRAWKRLVTAGDEAELLMPLQKSVNQKNISRLALTDGGGGTTVGVVWVLMDLGRLERSATPAPELGREPVEVRLCEGVCGGSMGIFEPMVEVRFGEVEFGIGDPALFTR
jgi:hypothetical protein